MRDEERDRRGKWGERDRSIKTKIKREIDADKNSEEKEQA